MVVEAPSPTPGILDFQDAVYGPITYDLASLFKDAYIRWEEEECWTGSIRYWEKARKAGLPVHEDFGEFYRDYEWMGVQRHLKVLGIFCAPVSPRRQGRLSEGHAAGDATICAAPANAISTSNRC